MDGALGGAGHLGTIGALPQMTPSQASLPSFPASFFLSPAKVLQLASDVSI